MEVKTWEEGGPQQFLDPVSEESALTGGLVDHHQDGSMLAPQLGEHLAQLRFGLRQPLVENPLARRCQGGGAVSGITSPERASRPRNDWAVTAGPSSAPWRARLAAEVAEQSRRLLIACSTQTCPAERGHRAPDAPIEEESTPASARGALRQKAGRPDSPVYPWEPLRVRRRNAERLTECQARGLSRAR